MTDQSPKAIILRALLFALFMTGFTALWQYRGDGREWYGGSFWIEFGIYLAISLAASLLTGYLYNRRRAQPEDQPA